MDEAGGPDELTKGPRSPWKLVLKALVTASVVAALYFLVDFRAVAGRLAHASLPLCAAAIACSLVAVAIMAQRWRLIVRNDGADPSFFDLYSCYLESTFFGLFLPSSVGGDLYRGVRIYGQLGGARRAAVNILAERLIGVWGICLLGMGGMIISGIYRTPLGRGLLAPYAAVLVVSALLVSKSAQRVVNSALRWARLGRIADMHDLALEQWQGYLRAPGLLAKLLALTVIQQGVASVSAYFMGSAAGLSLWFPFYLVAMPITWLASLVPALGGMGPREGTFAYLAIAAGADRQGAVAAAGLFLALNVTLGLVGGIIVLGRRVGGLLREGKRSSSQGE
jgi:hypothetical protein